MGATLIESCYLEVRSTADGQFCSTWQQRSMSMKPKLRKLLCRLSRVVFGLLSAVGHVARDFARDNAWRSKVNVTLTVFLRADIFSMVLRHAREPDKIDILQIRWPDRQLLSRVIEDRYASVSDAPGEELWNRLFGAEVNGMRTREYMLCVYYLGPEFGLPL